MGQEQGRRLPSSHCLSWRKNEQECSGPHSVPSLCPSLLLFLRDRKGEMSLRVILGGHSSQCLPYARLQPRQTPTPTQQPRSVPYLAGCISEVSSDAQCGLLK